MNHDPLCPIQPKITAGIGTDENVTAVMYEMVSLDTRCECDLIAKVRADEREEAWIVGYNTGFKYGLEEANITMEEYQERSRNMYKLGKALEELANGNEDT